MWRHYCQCSGFFFISEFILTSPVAQIFISKHTIGNCKFLNINLIILSVNNPNMILDSKIITFLNYHPQFILRHPLDLNSRFSFIACLEDVCFQSNKLCSWHGSNWIDWRLCWYQRRCNINSRQGWRGVEETTTTKRPQRKQSLRRFEQFTSQSYLTQFNECVNFIFLLS